MNIHLFQFTLNSVFQSVGTSFWNSSYHWLIIVDNYNKANDEVDNITETVRLKLNFDSELFIAFLSQRKLKSNIINEIKHYDVYRTSEGARGQLISTVMNESSYGQWGNRLWKYDQREDLKNMTLNVALVVS